MWGDDEGRGDAIFHGAPQGRALLRTTSTNDDHLAFASATRLGGLPPSLCVDGDVGTANGLRPRRFDDDDCADMGVTAARARPGDGGACYHRRTLSATRRAAISTLTGTTQLATRAFQRGTAVTIDT